MKWKLLFIVLLMTFGTMPMMAQTSSGPRQGSLVVVGGDFKVGTERFVSLAGGPDANFVYIPTAASSIRLPSGFIYEPPDYDTPAANTREFEQEGMIGQHEGSIDVLQRTGRAEGGWIRGCDECRLEDRIGSDS